MSDVDAFAVNLTYVLEQGARGTHILFENEEIRDAFANQERLPPVDEAPEEGVQAAVRSLAALPSRPERRAVIAALPQDERDLLILLYFRFLDQYLTEHRLPHH